MNFFKINLKTAIRFPLIKHNLIRNATTHTVKLIPINILHSDGTTQIYHGKEGKTFLDFARDNEIDLEGACGGECSCSTCHIVLPKELYKKLPKISDDELEMLEFVLHREKYSRLGCQVHISKDMANQTIKIPACV